MTEVVTRTMRASFRASDAENVMMELRIALPIRKWRVIREQLTSTDDGDKYVTEYYGASSIYALRPVTEEVARDHYAKSDPRPVRPSVYRPEAQIEDQRDDEVDEDPEW